MTFRSDWLDTWPTGLGTRFLPEIMQVRILPCLLMLYRKEE